MFKYPFNIKSDNWNPGKNTKTTVDWLPFKEICGNIIVLKNEMYLTILEISPVNFKLRSKIEKRSIILNYREFLKACNFPMQISIQCRKASIAPHISKMEKCCKDEENQNAKWMGKGYIELIKSLGTKGAVSRRFFLILPYVPPKGVKEITIEEVGKQLTEKILIVKEYLKQCGNSVIEPSGICVEDFLIEILKTCVRKNI